MEFAVVVVVVVVVVVMVERQKKLRYFRVFSKLCNLL
jgi:hypothetical protein